MFKCSCQKTKIICTIGPSSSSLNVLRELISSGMNVARLNFAHGTVDEMRKNIKMIRTASSEEGRFCSIFADLPGPKIRLGMMKKEPVLLRRGKQVILTTDEVEGDDKVISVRYKELTKSVAAGGTIFLFDGFIQLKILKVMDKEVLCETVIGGELFSNKGVNLPGAKLFFDSVSEKDLQFLEFALKEGIHIFGVSFVKDKSDLLKVREHARKLGEDIKLISKIERAEALENIEEIIEVSDGIMIARGDLGVQIPIENVPIIQKRLILKANRMSIPVITATQMLVSMTKNIRPTRAETTDVANAILDGTDAVMLSEETAVGKFPVETVKMMSLIAEQAEKNRNKIDFKIDHKSLIAKADEEKACTVEDVISLNAVEASEKLKTKFILTPTMSGSTPRRISRFKPDCWTLAFTRKNTTREFLNFSYGVLPFILNPNDDKWSQPIIDFLRSNRMVEQGETIVLTQGISPGVVGGTDSLRIITI
jgi:pyruvate kinase